MYPHSDKGSLAPPPLRGKGHSDGVYSPQLAATWVMDNQFLPPEVFTTNTSEEDVLIPTPVRLDVSMIKSLRLREANDTPTNAPEYSQVSLKSCLDESIPCPFCDTVLDESDLLIQHVNEVHPHEDESRFRAYLLFRERTITQLLDEQANVEVPKDIHVNPEVPKCEQVNIEIPKETGLEVGDVKMPYGSLNDVKMPYGSLNNNGVTSNVSTVDYSHFTIKEELDEERALTAAHAENLMRCLMCDFAASKLDPVQMIKHVKKNHKGYESYYTKTSDVTWDIVDIIPKQSNKEFLCGKWVSASRPIGCFCCDKFFLNVGFIRNHLARKHPHHGVVVQGELMRIDLLKNLQLASIKDFPSAVGKWFSDNTCPVCGCRFMDAAGLSVHVSAIHKEYAVYENENGERLVQNVDWGDKCDNSALWKDGVSSSADVLTCSLCDFRTLIGGTLFSTYNALRSHLAIRHVTYRLNVPPRSIYSLILRNKLKTKVVWRIERSTKQKRKRDRTSRTKLLKSPHHNSGLQHLSVDLTDIMAPFAFLPSHLKPSLLYRRVDKIPSVVYRCSVCHGKNVFWDTKLPNFIIHTKLHLAHYEKASDMGFDIDIGRSTLVADCEIGGESCTDDTDHDKDYEPKRKRSRVTNPDRRSSKRLKFRLPKPKNRAEAIFMASVAQLPLLPTAIVPTFDLATQFAIASFPIEVTDPTTAIVTKILQIRSPSLRSYHVDGVGLYLLTQTLRLDVQLSTVYPLTQYPVNNGKVEISRQFLDEIWELLKDHAVDKVFILSATMKRDLNHLFLDGQLLFTIDPKLMEPSEYRPAEHTFALGVSENWTDNGQNRPPLPDFVVLDVTTLVDNRELTNHRRPMSMVFETNNKPLESIPPGIHYISTMEPDLMAMSEYKSKVLSILCGTMIPNVPVHIVESEEHLRREMMSYSIPAPVHRQIFVVVKRDQDLKLYAAPNLMTDCCCPSSCQRIPRQKMTKFLRKIRVITGDEVSVCIGQCILDTKSTRRSNCSLNQAVYRKFKHGSRTDPITNLDGLIDYKTPAKGLQKTRDKKGPALAPNQLAFKMVRKNNTNEVIYRCAICSLGSRSLPSMRNHFKLLHSTMGILRQGPKWFVHNRCLRESVYLQKLRSRVRGKRTQKCVRSKLRMSLSTEYRSRTLTAENTPARKLPDNVAARRLGQMYECQLCLIKVMRGGDLIRHYRRYNKTYHIRPSKKGHLYTVDHKAPDYKFKCDKCGQGYRSLYRLEKHFRTHEKHQPFEKSISYEYRISNDVSEDSSGLDGQVQTDALREINQMVSILLSDSTSIGRDCVVCLKRFESSLGLVRHYKMWNSLDINGSIARRRKKLLQCKKCLLTLPSSLGLLNHIFESHQLYWTNNGSRRQIDTHLSEHTVVEGARDESRLNFTVQKQSDSSETVYDMNELQSLPNCGIWFKHLYRTCFSMSASSEGQAARLGLILLPVTTLQIDMNSDVSSARRGKMPNAREDKCTWCHEKPWLQQGKIYSNLHTHECSNNRCFPFNVELESATCHCGYNLLGKGSRTDQHVLHNHSGIIVHGYLKCDICGIDTFSDQCMLDRHQMSHHMSRDTIDSAWLRDHNQLDLRRIYGDQRRFVFELNLPSCDDWVIDRQSSVKENIRPAGEVSSIDTAEVVTISKFSGLRKMKVNVHPSPEGNCEHCGLRSNNRHRNAHHNGTVLPCMWQCSFCRKRFGTVQAFGRHEPCQKLGYNCHMCPKVTYTLNEHMKHVRNPGHILHNYMSTWDPRISDPTSNDIFRCRHCPRSFTSRLECLEHSVVHEVNLRGRMVLRESYCCGVCEFEFTNRNSLRVHESLHDNLECSFCGLLHTNIDYLQKHMFTNHIVRTVPKLYQDCGFCGSSKRGNTLSTVMYERRCDYDHYVSKCCRYCGTTFRRQCDLGKHLYEAHREQVKTHCRRCGAWFPTRNLLMRHLILKCRKVADLRHTCFCGAKFSSRLKLLLHKWKTHRSVHPALPLPSGKSGSTQTSMSIRPKVKRSYKCRHCPRKFKERRAILLHLRLAHKISHRCDRCQINFHSFKKLHQHDRVFHAALFFQCHICQVRIRSRLQLDQHIINMHYQYYHCKICRMSFEFEQDHVHHVQLHEEDCSNCHHLHAGRTCPEYSLQHFDYLRNFSKEKWKRDVSTDHFECLVCKQLFPKSSLHTYESHWNVHALVHEQTIIKCEHCEYNTLDHPDLHSHMSLNHQDKFHQCTKCLLHFTHADTLRYHERYCHLTTRKQLIVNKCAKSAHYCTPCELVFHSIVDSFIHMAKVHSGKNCDFACPICGKALYSKQKCVEHIPLHMDTFCCLHCHFTSNKMSTIQSHMTSKHDDIKVSYKCLYCPKLFKKETTLMSHMANKHTEFIAEDSNMVALCKDCGKFIVRTKLKQHKLFAHTIERKFECGTCGAKFKFNHHLKNHMLSHSERTFTCQDCDMKFRMKHHLESHQRSFHGLAGYKCNDCGEVFKLRWKRTHHRRQVHNMKYDDEDDDLRSSKNRF